MVLIYKFTHAIILVISLPMYFGFPMEKVKSSLDMDPIKYLKSFGWLEPQSTNIKEALQNFKAFARVNQTGEFDSATLNMMIFPRYGESDTNSLGSRVEDATSVLSRKSKPNPTTTRIRKKRYLLHGSRWKSRTLRYNISKYTQDMPQAEVDLIISSAFKEWENASNITFVRAYEGKIHIDIRFEVKYHGDEETFDGPGGTTAHAYFPYYGGGIHFDDDEIWTSNSDWGVNLFQVATHEIGHALGLEHSDVQESVMAPFYKTYRRDFRLHTDDVLALQALYGKRVLTICDEPKIDAATTMQDGNTYLFKGSYVYLLSQQGQIVEGNPTAISVAFPGLPGNLDAVITRSNGVSYFFKNEDFWRVTNLTVDTGFPKKISEYFLGIPTHIDTALVFSVDENIYFFKGSQYWKFDHRLSPPVQSGYPKQIYDWNGIPNKDLDATLSQVDAYGNHFTYFFKNNQFWRFNDKSFTVFLADPPYPRLISAQIFGCSQ